MYLQAIDGFSLAGTERTKDLFTLFVRPFNFSQGLWETDFRFCSCTVQFLSAR